MYDENAVRAEGLAGTPDPATMAIASPVEVSPTRVLALEGIRRRVLALGAVALTAAVTAPPALAGTHHHRRHHHAAAARACRSANAPVGSASRQAIKSAVVCLINKQRAGRGLPALRESSLLDRSAQGWSDTMVATRQFTHGFNFAGRISAVGFAWSTAGENIATGFATPRTVVNAWMASTGHCQNILNPTFSSVGTGVVNRVVGGFASQGATWTEDFALPLGHRPPSGNVGPMDGCPY
jgi:uncharacterized protein YkwD